MSNVREIRLAKNPLAGAADKMARDMPALNSAFAAIAKARKAYYDAHIDAGFTPDQALELVRSFSEQAVK